MSVGFAPVFPRSAHTEPVGIDRDEWITNLLIEETKDLEEVQRQLR